MHVSIGNTMKNDQAYQRQYIGSSLVQAMAFNPLRAIFFRGNINIYLHFVSFPHIDTTQVVEILPQIRLEPTYSA